MRQNREKLTLIYNIYIMSGVGRSQTESGVEAQLNEDYLFELRPL